MAASLTNEEILSRMKTTERVTYQFKKLFNGKISILYDDPQSSPGNFRVVGYGQRAADRMPDVDMTSFLVIYDIPQFAKEP